jgi:hypothetical protein
MSKTRETKVGERPPADAKRDAIHVAVYPAVNVGKEPLQPGEWMKDGVVDPFLAAPVMPGERYWLFLYPGSISSLRHVWSHKNFGDEKESEKP